MVAAILAGLGNSPGPTLTVVRQTTTGAHPPQLLSQHQAYRVILPEHNKIVELSLWEYGKPTPLIRIRALDPNRRAFPKQIDLRSRQLHLLPATDFAIEMLRKGEDRYRPLGARLGWFAVRITDTDGNTSVRYFEAGRQWPRGYLSCGRGRLAREDTAKTLTPPAVRAYFMNLFKTLRPMQSTPRVVPPIVPPTRKSPPPAPPPAAASRKKRTP